MNFTKLTCAVCGFILALPSQAFPAPVISQEIAKVYSSDISGGDKFGFSADLSGDLAIIGAPENDSNGNNSGAAYLFRQNQGGADAWGEVKKLLAYDAAASDFFGHSVAVSGDIVVVSSRGDDSQKGSAYVFQKDVGGANNWGFVKKLIASDGAANHSFGQAVDIDSDTIVVGASGAGNGAAYVFSKNHGGSNNWGQVKKITVANDSDAFGDLVGNSVGVSGDLIALGAPFQTLVGSAFVFSRNQGGANNWGQVAQLVPSDGASGDYFGFSLSIFGDDVLVGAVQKNSGAGGAYLFSRNYGGANNWGQRQKLVASDNQAGDQFGLSVSIRGEGLVIGAQADDDNGAESGAAYFYRTFAGSGNVSETRKIVPADGAAGDLLGGYFIAGPENGMVGVGAYADDDGGTDAGSAYLFSITRGSSTRAAAAAAILTRYYKDM